MVASAAWTASEALMGLPRVLGRVRREGEGDCTTPAAAAADSPGARRPTGSM